MQKKLIIFNPSIEDGGVENLYIISNHLLSFFRTFNTPIKSRKKSKFNKKIKFTFPKINFA